MDFATTLYDMTGSLAGLAEDLVDLGVSITYALDPLYLVMLLGLLIWVQLGRIARALGGAPVDKGVARKIDQVDERIEVLTHDLKTLQAEQRQTQNALRGKPLSSERALAVYRHQTA